MIRATRFIEDIVRKYTQVVNPLAESGFPYLLWGSGSGSLVELADSKGLKKLG